MNDIELWISGGRVVDRPVRENDQPFSDRHLLHSRSLVKVSSSGTGTTIQWVMFAANWASLMCVGDMVASFIAPITLKYFNAGWFEEVIDSTIDARERLYTLLAKSDVRLIERTFVKACEPDHLKMPLSLQQIYETKVVPADSAVVCRINLDTELTSVESVGKDTPLAKVWGVTPVSYPCQTGHSYDKVVSRSYFEAARLGRPIYDHVLAAMVKPDSDVQWMQYQRVIIPEVNRGSNIVDVKVVCEWAPADIHPL
jgi:hypothetical protein